MLSEKAKSRAQQRFFGMVRAAQKGEAFASPEVAKVASEISKKDAKDFASTKHKGLPEKKKLDEIAPALAVAGKVALGAVKKAAVGAVKQKAKQMVVQKAANVAQGVIPQPNRDQQEGFKSQYNKPGKLSQSSQRKSLGRGASINPDAKSSGYESKAEHRKTSKKLAPYQTKGTYNAHLHQEGVGRAAIGAGLGAMVGGPVGAAAGAAIGASLGKKKVTTGGNKVKKKATNFFKAEPKVTQSEAKVDAGKDDVTKEDDRNKRKFGHVPYNQHGHSVLRRAMHRSDRKVKKIKGLKEPANAYGEQVNMEGVMDIVRKYNKKKEAPKHKYPSGASGGDAGKKAKETLVQKEREKYVSPFKPVHYDHKTWNDYKKHI